MANEEHGPKTFKNTFQVYYMELESKIFRIIISKIRDKEEDFFIFPTVPSRPPNKYYCQVKFFLKLLVRSKGEGSK